MTIGHKIKSLRLARNIQATDLAEQIGVKKSHLSDCESGRRHLSETALRKVCRILDVNYDYLNSFDSRLPTRELMKLTLADKEFGSYLRRYVYYAISNKTMLHALKQFLKEEVEDEEEYGKYNKEQTRERKLV